jgi:polysaccharide biosynthesis/export protein
MIVVSVMALQGCASRPFESNSRLEVVNAASLPVPQRADLVAPGRENLIGPLDTLGIEVFGVADLTREVQVDAGGKIQFPLIGTIGVAGSTTDELALLVSERLHAAYVRNPQVIVNLTRSVSQVVTIDGQVQNPGAYPVTNQTTLLRAVAAAQGLTEFGKQDEVVVLRTVGSKRMAGLYSLDAIRRGNYDDPRIFANDIVYVGESSARRFFKNVLAIAPLLVSPTVAVIQR